MRELAISIRFLRQTILLLHIKRRLMEDYILLISSRGIPDSISKYAQLFVNANDSSYRHSTVESMYNIQSMYDYQHYQQRAMKAQTENQLLWLSMALGTVVLFLVAVVVFYTYASR